MLKIVIAVSYYSPYVSGLTNVARDVAEGLAARGHDVVVVANRHDDALPRTEVLNSVRIVRTPVAVRFGKGVLSPGYVRAVAREALDADIVNVHAPMLEAGRVVARVRGNGRARLAVTYHCDVVLPPGLINGLQVRVMDRSSRSAAKRSDAVVVTSDDYAEHSRVREALASRRVVIPPGCSDRRGGSPALRRGPGVHVGFLGRIVEEKGIEYLVEGFGALDDPDARLLIAGDFTSVAGGSVIDRVRDAIGADDRIDLLGFLDERQLADFYASLDVFALPSVNSLEAFGIVQVEAMIAGVPALSSDLPGVRQPIEATGFGMVVPPRDAESITRGLNTLAGTTFDRPALASLAERLYGIRHAIDGYERLFACLARTPS